MNYLENLKVLRDAVAAEPAENMYLNAWTIKAPCGTLHCIGGLAATMPYFHSLGMWADGTGAPCSSGRAPSEALEHFFGRYEVTDELCPDVGAVRCIFAGFECGRWDRELAAAAGAIIEGCEEHIDDYIDTDKMDDKQLALARLDKAITYWEERQNG